MVVVTNLLDAAKFTKSKLSKYYKKRWKIEVALKDLKNTFKMSHINAKTPEMVEKIIWAHMRAYNILRWHMLNAATCPSGKIPGYSVFERLILRRACDIPGHPFFGIRFNLMGVA